MGKIKDGKMLAWVVGVHDVTVDLYESLSGYLANSSPMPYFEKAYPGKDITGMMEKTNAAATLVKSEVRLILDTSRW